MVTLPLRIRTPCFREELIPKHDCASSQNLNVRFGYIGVTVNFSTCGCWQCNTNVGGCKEKCSLLCTKTVVRSLTGGGRLSVTPFH